MVALLFILGADPWGAVTALSGAGAFIVLLVGAVVKLVGDRDDKRDAAQERIRTLELRVDELTEDDA